MSESVYLVIGQVEQNACCIDPVYQKPYSSVETWEQVENKLGEVKFKKVQNTPISKG